MKTRQYRKGENTLKIHELIDNLKPLNRISKLTLH